MDGFIVICAEAGRAVRAHRAGVRACDVLSASGELHAGGRVHVVVRGVDGGQNVIASGLLDRDAQALHPSVFDPACAHAEVEPFAADVVIQSLDLELLWQSRR